MARKHQPGWAMYKEQMDFLCFGDALWEPSPTNGHPRVNIGDVGFIRRGKFHLLFSASSQLGDRRRGYDVPTSFQQLLLGAGTLDSSQPRQPGCLRTSTVRQVGVELGAAVSASLPLEPGANFSFELTEDRGAALVTKYSTYRMDTLAEYTFKEYTEHHYKSWVEFARDKGYGRDVRPVLVTGFDVTRDFAMVAYSHGETSVESDLTITVPTLASASASLWGTWRTKCSPHTNYGPQECGPHPPMQPIEFPSFSSREVPNIPAEFNQCVFIRYFTMRWKMAMFPKVIRAGAGPHDLGSGDNTGDSFHQITVQSGSQTVVSNMPSDEEYDSWNVIADYVFQNSNAVRVLIHNDDLEGIRRAEETDDISALLVKYRPPIRVDSSGVGRISCREIQRPELPAQPAEVPVEHGATQGGDSLNSLRQPARIRSPAQSQKTTVPTWLQQADRSYISEVRAILRARFKLRRGYQSFSQQPQGKPPAGFYPVSVGASYAHQISTGDVDAEPRDRTPLVPRGHHLNADWVQELHGKKWWIATKVLSETAYTFLSVLLEPVSPPGLPASRVRTIVELSDDTEPRRRLAHPYLPGAVGHSMVVHEDLGVSNRSFEVTVTGEDVITDIHCTRRTVVITQQFGGVAKGTPILLDHLSCTAWPCYKPPDHGGYRAVVDFVIQVDTINRKLTLPKDDPDPPVIVTCSSHYDSTDAFITLSSLLRSHSRLPPAPISAQSQSLLSLSPLGPLPPKMSEDPILQEIESYREHRPRMVPTLMQFSFLYSTLERVLFSG